MRYIDDNSGITFNNVKKIGSLIENCPSGNPNRYWYSDLNNSTVTGTDDTFNSINPNILGVINAIDIDWNEALVEDHVTVSTTGELINWIKTRPLVIALSFNPKILIATVNGVNIYIPDFLSQINALESRIAALENGTELPVENYTVTFNINEGDGQTPPPQTATKNSNIVLPLYDGNKTGFKNLHKWNTKSDGTGISYNAEALYTITGNITLYAKWEALEYYIVTYNSNGGTGNSELTSIEVPKGTTIVLRSYNGTKEGFENLHKWNTKSDGTGIFYYLGSSYTVNNNITLYAEWSAISDVEVTNLLLDKSTLSIPANSTGTIKGTIVPNNATNKTINWTSSDETIATVTSSTQSGNNATVIWRSQGTVNIIATSAGDTTKTATCAVTCLPVSVTPTTEYYWYVGQTDPSTMSSISPIVTSYNNGGGWYELGTTVPETITQLVKGGDSTKYWYTAVPITSGTTLKPVASDMTTLDNSVTAQEIKVFNGVTYQIYWYGGYTAARNRFIFAKK